MRWQDLVLCVPQLRVRTRLAYLGGRYRPKSPMIGSGRVPTLDEETADVIALNPPCQRAARRLAFATKEVLPCNRTSSPTCGPGRGQRSTSRDCICTVSATAMLACCSTRRCPQLEEHHAEIQGPRVSDEVVQCEHQRSRLS